VAACRPRACCPRSCCCCCCYRAGYPAPPLRSWLRLSVTLLVVRESTGNESISEVPFVWFMKCNVGGATFALATVVPCARRMVRAGGIEWVFFIWKVKIHFYQSTIHNEVSSISGMESREQGASERKETGKFYSGVLIGSKRDDQTTPFPLLGDLCGSPNGRENTSSAAPAEGDPVSPATRRNPTERKMQSHLTRLDHGGALTTGERDVRAPPPRGTPGAGGGCLEPPEVLVGSDGGGDGDGEAESREGRGEDEGEELVDFRVGLETGRCDWARTRGEGVV
jgi:hypothetical protein